MRSGEEEKKKEEEEKEKSANIKSNNPHLAGGEIAFLCWRPCRPPQNRDKMITSTGPHMPIEQTANIIFQRIFLQPLGEIALAGAILAFPTARQWYYAHRFNLGGCKIKRNRQRIG